MLLEREASPLELGSRCSEIERKHAFCLQVVNWSDRDRTARGCRTAPRIQLHECELDRLSACTVRDVESSVAHSVRCSGRASGSRSG